MHVLFISSRYVCNLNDVRFKIFTVLCVQVVVFQVLSSLSFIAH
jgi:hypothetical protein